MKKSFRTQTKISSWFYLFVMVFGLLHAPRLFAGQTAPDLPAQPAAVSNQSSVEEQIQKSLDIIKQPNVPAPEVIKAVQVIATRAPCAQAAARAAAQVEIARLVREYKLAEATKQALQNTGASLALSEQVKANPANLENDLNKELINLNPMPEPEIYNAQVDRLESIIGDLASKPLSTLKEITAKELCIQKVKDFALNYPPDSASIDNLKGLLEKAQNNPIIDDLTRRQIQVNFLPAVVNALNSAQQQEAVTPPAPVTSQDRAVQQQIQTIETTMTDPNQQITALGNLMQQTAASGQPISQATQQLFSQKLHDLYETTPLDPQILANLAYVINNAATVSQNQATPLLDPLALRYVQMTLLPSINQDQQVAQFTQEINAAMAQPTTVARATAVSTVADTYASTPMPDSAKNFYAQTLQTLFNERYSTQVLVGQQAQAAKKTKKASTKKKKKKKKKKVGAPKTQGAMQGVA